LEYLERPLAYLQEYFWRFQLQVEVAEVKFQRVLAPENPQDFGHLRDVFGKFCCEIESLSAVDIPNFHATEIARQNVTERTEHEQSALSNLQTS
jgi:hypothetical protein